MFVICFCFYILPTDLLAAWEDLLGWSENAAAARKMQEDMIVLKHSLNRLGNKSSFELLDTEPSIQIAIEALKVRINQEYNKKKQRLYRNLYIHYDNRLEIKYIK